MQLMSMKCPNCNGTLKMVNEGTFYCANCDSAFMADYDKDDVEIQKMKIEAEIRKQKLGQAQTGAEVEKRKAKDQFRIKVIVISIVAVFFLIITVPTVIVTLQSEKKAVETRLQEEKDRQARYEAEEKEKEEKRKQEQAAKEAEEQAARQAKLASYRLSAEELTSDDFFVENANKAIEVQLWDNTSLFYDNWVWNVEPEYITSYFLTAKDENAKVQSILVSLYKITWDREDDDGVDQYVMYDGACLYNVSRNEDGTVRSDYDPEELSYHDELIRNQFISGYTEYDQLVRQEIYGNADYDYFEFTMPQD
ncbi:MAG: hypothetical protein K5669_11270 [Lachnospiraceae bacterium]|nr:hypothetical protein [Lachnospiraceae bacterium]